LDPESLVDTFLWEKASLRRTYMNHQLLKAREKATKRELEIIYRKLSLTLHPDKGVFHNWLMENYPDLDTDSYTNATNLMKHFWDTWQATKERLMDLEDGFFKQAGVFVVCACMCDLCLAHAFLSTYGSESVSIHLQKQLPARHSWMSWAPRCGLTPLEPMIPLSFIGWSPWGSRSS
jgi:hypothetical protein